MPQILFTVSYEVAENNITEYLKLVGSLKKLLRGTDVTYNVFEAESKRNQFEEVYLYPSRDAFEAADDNDNPEVNELVDKIGDLAKNRKISYSTKIERI